MCSTEATTHSCRRAASEPLASLPNVTRRVWDGLRHECMNEPEHAEVIAEIITWINAQLDV